MKSGRDSIRSPGSVLKVQDGTVRIISTFGFEAG